MSSRLVNASKWTLGLVYGVFFGVFMGLFGYLQDHELAEHVILGLISGAAFGALMGPLTAKQNKEALAASGEDLSPDERLVVIRAMSNRRPVPDDARIRKAATGVLTHRLSVLEGQWWSYLLYAGLAVASIVMTFTLSPWWAVATFLFVGLAAFTYTARIRMERRIIDLQAGQEIPA